MSEFKMKQKNCLIIFAFLDSLKTNASMLWHLNTNTHNIHIRTNSKSGHHNHHFIPKMVPMSNAVVRHYAWNLYITIWTFMKKTIFENYLPIIMTWLENQPELSYIYHKEELENNFEFELNYRLNNFPLKLMLL